MEVNLTCPVPLTLPFSLHLFYFYQVSHTTCLYLQPSPTYTSILPLSSFISHLHPASIYHHFPLPSICIKISYSSSTYPISHTNYASISNLPPPCLYLPSSSIFSNLHPPSLTIFHLYRVFISRHLPPLYCLSISPYPTISHLHHFHFSNHLPLSSCL